MANYATLKAAIDAVIKANGQREITGTVLNQTLNAMVNSLGANYQLAGVATPSTNPGTPDQNVFYLAFEAGTYTNFNATVLSAGISILMWNGSWSSQTFYTIDATPTASSDNLVSSGAVFDAIKTDGSAYDVSAHFPTGGPNNDGKFTLEYILSNVNTLIPTAWRKGGMSIRFVSSSDNKYIQARCMAQNFTTDVTQWQGVDETPTAGSKNLVESSGIKGAIDGMVEILNVNNTFNHPAAFTTKFDAYAAVTSSYRKKGLYITYLYNSGTSGEVDHWVTEQFVGNIETEWGDSSKWVGKDTVIEQTMYTEALAAIPAWIANTPYVVGNQVKNNGKYYYCNTATSGDSEFPTSKFSEITTFAPAGYNLCNIKIGETDNYVLSNLVHIKGWGSFDTAPNKGDILYHTNSHRLLRNNGNTTFSTIPYYVGMLAEYDGNLYRWNGSDLILANNQKFNVSDIDTSLANPNSDSKVLSEKATNDLVTTKLDSIQQDNMLYSSYLEQGTIDDNGNDGESSVRVRFSHKIGVPFVIKINDRYGIIKAFLYNKQTGSLSNTINMTSRDYSYFKSDGIYDVRLLIRNINSWGEPISPTEDIIDYILPYEKEKSEELLGIDYATLLEIGSINYVTGENETATSTVRFVNKLTRPFTIETTSDYVIYQISLYDRFTGDFISSSYAASGTRTYISNGEYGVRLTIRGNNSANIIPEAAGSVIKSFGDAVDDISSSLYTETATYCTINDMPDAARKKFAILTTTPNGPIWSDKSVWRFMKDNLLAVTAKSYAVMSLDNDTIINEHSKDEVHTLFSATKLMTSVITVETLENANIPFTQSVTVIAGDILIGEEDNEHVNVGDVITYEGLLKNMMIPSDNNAPSVLSRCVGYIINPSAQSDTEAKNAFIAAMQAKAVELGMSNTTYPGAISTGKSSASDICKLLKYIYNNVSAVSDIWGLASTTVTITGENARTYTIYSTTNAFARNLIPEFVGGKTGTGTLDGVEEGVYCIIWHNSNNNKYYALCLLACIPPNNQRFIDTRHIIDESYEIL